MFVICRTREIMFHISHEYERISKYLIDLKTNVFYRDVNIKTNRDILKKHSPHHGRYTPTHSWPRTKKTSQAWSHQVFRPWWMCSCSWIFLYALRYPGKLQGFTVSPCTMMGYTQAHIYTYCSLSMVMCKAIPWIGVDSLLASFHSHNSRE